jgi:type IV pilus assembly protein PilF
MKHQPIKSIIALLSVMLFLSACVTTQSSPPPPKADPQRALRTYVQMGLEYVALGKTQDAKGPLSRALEIDSRSPEANAALAYMYQKDEEPALAEEYFKKAINYNPKYTTGHNNYGMFLYTQGRYEEALAQLKIASEDTLYEKRAQVFNNIGLVYFKMGKMAEAEAAFNKSKILDGGNPQTYLEIAQVNFDIHEYNRAQAAYETYVKLKPQQDPSGLWLGIRLAKAMGKKDDQMKYAAQLKKSYPTSDEYLNYATSLERK